MKCLDSILHLCMICLSVLLPDSGTTADTKEDCSHYDDGSFWGYFGEGFMEVNFTAGTPEYWRFVHFHVSAASRTNRAPRQVNKCQKWDSYFLSETRDGDSCCDTRRAKCLWFSGMPDPTEEAAEVYPIWSARVFPDLTINIRYQYWYDISCISLERTCSSCREIAHERKVLVSTVRPSPLLPYNPGKYGHAYVRINNVRFQRFHEMTYCYCSN